MTALQARRGSQEVGNPDQGRACESADKAEQRARSVLLRQLSASPKTRWQLEQKLADQEVPREVAVALLDRFEELGLVDDATFARLWVESRSRTRSLARGALRRELADKGVPPDDIEEALSQLTEEDELGSAREVVRRRMPSDFGSRDRAGRDKAVRRLVAMLGRKGYGSGLAFRVVVQECEAAAEAVED